MGRLWVALNGTERGCPWDACWEETWQRQHFRACGMLEEKETYSKQRGKLASKEVSLLSLTDEN